MTIFSSLRAAAGSLNAAKGLIRPLVKPTSLQNVAVRRMGGHDNHFPFSPTRFQWDKFKDLLHYYVLIGAIPALAVVFYTNVFIGPATLTEIPDGYRPKHWEYVRHPITRWMARYWYSSPQEDYEKMLHYLAEEQEKIKVRKLEEKIKRKMAENQDYEAYYYKPITAKYHRLTRDTAKEQVDNLLGD